jgi:hypothetical protein
MVSRVTMGTANGHLGVSCSWRVKLTVIPPYRLATGKDTAKQAASTHTAEDRVGFFGYLLRNLLDHGAMPFPKQRLIIGVNQHPVASLFQSRLRLWP